MSAAVSGIISKFGGQSDVLIKVTHFFMKLSGFLANFNELQGEVHGCVLEMYYFSPVSL